MSPSTEPSFFTFDRAALPDRKAYPLADLIVLAESIELTLHEDGRTEKTVRRAWLYNSGFAREKLSDVTIPFVAGRQKVEVHTARTFMRSGPTVDTPGYGRNEIVPFALDRAPDLGHVRELVVSLVGTEVGGVSLLEYTVADLEPWKDFFWGEVLVGTPFPVLEKTLAVKVPRGATLNTAARNMEVEPERTEKDGFQVFSWKWTDLPAHDPDEGLEFSDALAPAVQFSAAGGWHEVTGKFAGRLADASVGHPTFAKTVEEKAKSGADAVEKALLLHKFVLEGVRTLDFHPALIDLSVRPASKVLDCAYGTALEKGVLLAALAQVAGLKARVHLARGTYGLTESVAYPGDRPVTWVEFPVGGKPLLLRPDKAAHEANNRHLEDMALIPLSEAGEPAPLGQKRPASASSFEVSLTLKNDLSLEGSVECVLEGGFNPYFKTVTDEKATVEKLAGEIASKLIPSAKVKNVRASMLAGERTALRFDVEGAKAARTGAFVDLSWPDLPSALHGFKVAVHREERRTPLALPTTARVSLEMEVALPKNATVKIPPPPVRRRSSGANTTFSFEAKDAALSVKAVWDFPRKTVVPEDYGKFRKAVCAAANPEARTVLLGGI